MLIILFVAAIFMTCNNRDWRSTGVCWTID